MTQYYMVGTLPPPLGGVSVFVSRYSRLLRQQGHEVVHLMDRPLNKWQLFCQMWRLFLGSSRAVYYVNDFHPYAMLALLLRPRHTEIVFHYHAGEMLERYRGWKKWLFRAFLRRTGEMVLVRDIRNHFESHAYRLPARTQVRYAFLPPPPEDEPAILRTYASETQAFLEEHRPCLVANAFQITFYHGVDIYGLDMLVEALPAWIRSHPRLGLLIALAEIGDEEYFEALMSRARSLGVAGHLHFMTGQRELWPLLKRADLLVRPTCTDGDAVSIREAMHFGRPVVASDAAPRPEGVVTFANRDQAAFEAAVLRTLARNGHRPG